MVSDLKSDLVLTMSQRRSNVQLMGSPAVLLLLSVCPGVFTAMFFCKWLLPLTSAASLALFLACE